MTESDIRRFFSGFEVKSVSIKKGKGFGFVGLASHSEARRATGKLDKTKLLERVIGVQVAPPKK